MLVAGRQTMLTGTALFGALILFSATGCIEHRVAVAPPLAADAPPAGELPATTLQVTGSVFVNEPHLPTIQRSPLPIDVPVSVVRRASDGTLLRGEVRVTTPLPWWQRFPADAVCDAWPTEFVVYSSSMVSLTPVESVDQSVLLEQARRDGYARVPDVKTKP